MERKTSTSQIEKKILEAFLKCIYEYGVSKSSIRIIAKKAKVKAPVIQYYFTSRENLLMRLVEYLHERIASNIKSHYAHLDTPESRLQGLFDSLEDYVLNRRRELIVYYSVMQDCIKNSSARTIFAKANKRVENVVEGVLKEGIRKGVFNRIDAASLARSFNTFAKGCGVQRMLKYDTNEIKKDLEFFQENTKKILFGNKHHD